jgi:hypothetical protein
MRGLQYCDTATLASYARPFPADVDLDCTDKSQHNSHPDGHMTTSLAGSGIGKPGPNSRLFPSQPDSTTKFRETSLFRRAHRPSGGRCARFKIRFFPTRQVIRAGRLLEFFQNSGTMRRVSNRDQEQGRTVTELRAPLYLSIAYELGIAACQMLFPRHDALDHPPRRPSARDDFCPGSRIR